MVKIYGSFSDYVNCPKRKKSIKISKCENCDHCNEFGINKKTLGYFTECGWE